MYLERDVEVADVFLLPESVRERTLSWSRFLKEGRVRWLEIGRGV